MQLSMWGHLLQIGGLDYAVVVDITRHEDPILPVFLTGPAFNHAFMV